MTSESTISFELVTTDRRLRALGKELSQKSCIGLDTESDGFHRYPEQLSLVQLSSDEGVYIVDPLAIGNMAPLGRLLGNKSVEKIIHAADFDVRSLDRQWGFRIRNLFDTAVGAKFVGVERLGLASVAHETVGVSLPKEKRIQRADWSVRPLAEEFLQYAATDVVHLIEIREILRDRLVDLGRADWVAEECVRLAGIRYSAPDPQAAFLSVRGCGVLDGRGLAVLKTLYAFREEEARLRGVPPFRVLGERAMLTLAANPASELESVAGLTQMVLRRIGAGIHRALSAGVNSPRVNRASAPRTKRVVGEADRLKALKSWRKQEAGRLGLDAAALWPTASLERLAHSTERIKAELKAPEVRRWQRHHIAPLLNSYLRSGVKLY